MLLDQSVGLIQEDAQCGITPRHVRQVTHSVSDTAQSKFIASISGYANPQYEALVRKSASREENVGTKTRPGISMALQKTSREECFSEVLAA